MGLLGLRIAVLTSAVCEWGCEVACRRLGPRGLGLLLAGSHGQSFC